MKHFKSILPLAFLFVSVAGSGQSISVSNVDTYVTGTAASTLLQAHATVTNNGSAPIDVLVRFNEISLVPAAGHYFCWAVCYNEGSVNNGFQTPGSHSVSIDAGASVTNFYADYVPHSTTGVSTFEYCFFDKNNTQDETCIQITFDTQNVGIEDVFKSEGSGVSEAYPNPARSVANINYALHQGWRNAEITVYSMLGSKVKTVKLKEDQGTVKLDVASLPTGMYFYTLAVDGNTMQTRKMLVTK